MLKLVLGVGIATAATLSDAVDDPTGLAQYLNPQTGFLAFVLAALIVLARQHRADDVAALAASAAGNAVALAASERRAEEWKERALAQSAIVEAFAPALEENTKAVDHAIARLGDLAERRRDTPASPPPRANRRGAART